MNLYLIRHGDTANNGEDKITGWADLPLLPGGIKQAAKTQKFMSDKPVSKVYSSGLSRADDTAKIVFPGKPTAKDPRLKGLNSGELQGQHHSALNKYEGIWIQFPGVKTPGGESFSDFQDRLWKFRTSLDTAVDTAVVTHGRVIQWFLAVVANGGEKLTGEELQARNAFKILPGNVAKIEMSKTKSQILGVNIVEDNHG